MLRPSVTLAMLLALAGCNLAPHDVRPVSAVPDHWPAGPAYPAATDRQQGLTWQDLIGDPRLRGLVTRALADNRSLQATVADVVAARAQYHIQRSAERPAIDGNASASLTRGLSSNRSRSSSYDANIGLSSFEVDLFGRLHNLSRQAFEQYLATRAGLAATRIALISTVASSYVTLATDRDLLGVAHDTLQSAERSLQLTLSLHASGLAAMTDVANAQTVVAQAKSDIEQDTTLVAQDRNALELAVGGPVSDDLLPPSLDDLQHGISVLPAGLSSTILLQRPDVIAAEDQLKGANAGIGAARAAFFPTITLTSAVGVASSALSNLFTGGALNWSVAPQATLPILGGPNAGNLAYAKAQRDSYVAHYQYTVQNAFREVADALARRGTIDRQRGDQHDLVVAATRSDRLADAQYRAGTDTFLALLIAQRALYTARRTELGVISQDLLNRIQLYEYTGAEARS